MTLSMVLLYQAIGGVRSTAALISDCRPLSVMVFTSAFGASAPIGLSLSFVHDVVKINTAARISVAAAPMFFLNNFIVVFFLKYVLRYKKFYLRTRILSESHQQLLDRR